AAQRRLRRAEEMIEVVRKWAQHVRREIDEYRGRTRGFRNCLELEVPRTAALLERTVGVLESYADHPVVEAQRAQDEAAREKIMDDRRTGLPTCPGQGGDGRG